MHIIGTAGHVDHGKSSLVLALTGTNPDRWLEEQERGMTLDLGFAHLRFEDGIEAGIVDVPGHERFLHNMLAGAAGMELLLLVVAADDGVMPQTIEHLQILRYLNVKRIVVALTKVDLISPERRDEASRRVREQLGDTIARDAVIFAVSSVTGENLDMLKIALHDALAALPSREPHAPAYLPIDRVFVLPGRGTIVTGTLMQGRIAAGDSMALDPPGERVRARSLHVFGAARDAATGGTRVALNLPGIERAQIGRGAVLADPAFSARANFAVRFSALRDALPLIRRRTHVRAHIGSAEILGTLVIERPPADEGVVDAQLFLRRSVLAFPGVRFVLRRVSPKTLLGGGEIVALEGEAPAPSSDDHGVIRALLAQHGLEPQDVAAVAFAANVREEVAQNALSELAERGEAVALARPAAYLDAAAFTGFGARVVDALETRQRDEPWSMGVTSLALARLLTIDEPLVIRLLAALVEEGRIVQRHGYYATTDHQPKLSPEQRAFFEENVPLDPAIPFLPVAFDDLAAQVKCSEITGLKKAFDTLLARGVLVKIGDALYRGTQIERAHERIETFIASNGPMTMAQFRDLLGTSRKFAVPLLEWFDARGITVRTGDLRALRARKGAREQLV
ncbi:MAG TPA: selenocysteine-specific translation elongation factor [Candidatus Baltobacteraceae bacterium]|nr:selenocysteine-specific translation elongation factor [Candidatus Baltobacteraceae bacterium]